MMRSTMKWNGFFMIMAFAWATLSGCGADVDGWDDSAGPIAEFTNRVMLAGDPNLDPNWDWTIGDGAKCDPNKSNCFQLYWQTAHGISGALVNSPFFHANSTTYSDMRVDPHGEIDYLPRDGWVLLARDFGVPTSAPPVPYFALYNKYRGAVRFFFYNPSKGGSYVFATVKHVINKTALFTFEDDEKPFLDDYEKSLKPVFAGCQAAFPTSWNYAEFHTQGYDDDLSSKKGATLAFHFFITGKSMLDLEGGMTLEGTLEDANLLTTRRTSGTGESWDLEEAFNTASNAIEKFSKAKKVYDDVDSFIEDARKKGEKHQDKWWGQTLLGIADQTGSYIPYVGAAVGFISSFFGGEKSKVYFPTKWKHELTGDLWISGKIIQHEPLFPYHMQVPGTPHNAASDSSVLPLYDKPLGVLTLKTKPVIEHKVDMHFVCIDGPPGPVPCPGRKRNRYTYAFHYSLKNPITYVQNPHAGLKMKTFDVALVSGYGPSRYYDKQAFHKKALVVRGQGICRGDEVDSVKKMIRQRAKDMYPEVGAKITFEALGPVVHTPKELTMIKLYPAEVVYNAWMYKQELK